MLLSRLVETSLAVGDTRSRNDKTARLAACIAELQGEEVAIGVSFLSGRMRQGRIGLGYRAAMSAHAGAVSEPTLTLADVDATFAEITAAVGVGSTGDKLRSFGALLARATEQEQRFVRALVVGELRQGALEGVLLEAVARAARVPADAVRRAHMLTGDLSRVAPALLTEGSAALSRFGLELFRPLKPMLAQICDSPSAALARLGELVLETKIDGARIQVHKRGDEVKVFTRRLKEVTLAVPEVVEQVVALGARELILDGEVVALRPDGTPHPFQTTMRRFGRKEGVAAMRERLPLTPVFFDVLHADGMTLLDQPARERFACMRELLPRAAIITRREIQDAARADAFLGEVIRAGHEGLMAKSLGSTYEAGNRGSGWLKIKPAHTLDLVVLAAEWGHGRRRGWLSNVHLGARNHDGSFTMLGKTFKGMTDELLVWQTDALQRIAVSAEAHTVYVEPRLVVEVAFNDVQTSPHYPGGLALRFARIKRYRPDKSADDADTLDTVRAIHERAARG